MRNRRGVFLDRDGVLNRAIIGLGGTPHPPPSADAVEILPGVKDACQALRLAEYELVVVTNQPDVARGEQTRAGVEAINALVCSPLGIEHVRVCFHDDRDGCTCRKPLPGLIVQAALDLGIDTTSSYMVGDRFRDIDAGRRAGCFTILVGDGHGEPSSSSPDAVFPSLVEAAAWITSGAGSRHDD